MCLIILSQKGNFSLSPSILSKHNLQKLLRKVKQLLSSFEDIFDRHFEQDPTLEGAENIFVLVMSTQNEL